jgi:nitrite reductase (NADH) small subunit
MEGEAVVCPWHCWAFDMQSGEALPPERGNVEIFRLKIEGDQIWIDLA